MTDDYSIPLNVILPSMPVFDNVMNSLDDIFSKIGLRNIDMDIVLPQLQDTSLIGEDVQVQTEDLFFDDGPEVPPSSDIPISHDVIESIAIDTGSRSLSLQLKAIANVVIDLPGLEGVSLILNPGNFDAILTYHQNRFSLEFAARFAIRFGSDILRPLRRIDDDNGVINFVNDDDRQYVELNIGVLTVSFDSTGVLNLNGGIGLQISNPFMIGNTGVVIESADVSLNLTGGGPRPAGTPAGWRGLLINNALIRLPKIFNGAIRATGLGIGAGGVSGRIEGNFSIDYDSSTGNFNGDIVGTIFGIKGGVRELSLTFQQNIPAAGSIRCLAMLPFFRMSSPLDLDISLSSDGQPTIALHSPNGILILERNNLLRLSIDNLSITLEDDIYAMTLAGQLTPLLPGFSWPTFRIRDLVIDSNGNVRLDGGWLNLREQYCLNFHGFNIEITKLGFGKTEDGRKWIGFSGGIKLVDGIQAGASVEGLRIIWREDGSGINLTLNGIGVEFEIPNVLRFKGAVSYNPQDNRFSGNIKLHLISINLEIDARLVFGTSEGPQGPFTYFAIYLNADLPAGVPLFSTNLALYGMAGLFAAEMEPNKRPDEQWYGMDRNRSWYHRGSVGITDITDNTKWKPQPGSLAFGAGVTIGTVSDNGFSFSGKMLLAIIFPGPILLIEGRANLLKERAKLDSSGEEPNFRALAVLDNRAGTFLAGLDAQYRYNNEGRLIDIRGSAEAFYSLSDPNAWHIYLGQREPSERRIRAELFSLFQANAYFMLDANRLALGARVGYDGHWNYGPLGVSLEAWIEGNAAISWKPAYFHGDLWLHGRVAVNVFGFGLGLTADARVAADVFDPFHVKAQLGVSVDLPWPLPDFSVGVDLEWGPIPIPPPLPLPLKDIAIEHFKVTTSWPLPRNTLLIPNYDRGDGFYQEVQALRDDLPPPVPSSPSTNITLPVLPLDCRPHITFRRPVNDDARIGVNPQPANPEWERIGDPTKNEGPVKVRYGLNEIVLHKWIRGSPDHWEIVARKGSTSNPARVPTLFGSWAPIPNMPDDGGINVSQVKLWLWSKTPFDYTRHTGNAWNNWFTERFNNYPCVIEREEICFNFQNIDSSQIIQSPWQHPYNPKLRFSWTITQDFGIPVVGSIRILDKPIDGLVNAICFPSKVGTAAVFDNDITISLPEASDYIKITFIESEDIEARAFDDDNDEDDDQPDPSFVTFVASQNNSEEIEITRKHTNRVVLHSRSSNEICILKMCIALGSSSADVVSRRRELNQHLINELARWSQRDGQVLEPHEIYRLKVVTTLNTSDFIDAAFNRERSLAEYVYFRTEGPPGLVTMSTPINYPNSQEFSSGLDNLTPYVYQTIPATVPSIGEKPIIPRPVYRAYDIGVEFNENYVDLMYRLEQRDLGLYLYDNNNEPIRDTEDRLILYNNRWGAVENITLNESELHWISNANLSSCATGKLETYAIPPDNTLTSAAANQVLNPDTVYEARLIPLLLHEDFRNFALNSVITESHGIVGGGWRIYDQDSHSGNHSSWEVHKEEDTGARFIVQTSNFGGSGISSSGGNSNKNGIVKPGTILLRENNSALTNVDPQQPFNWTNYRFSTYLMSTDRNSIGVVFRYQDSNNYYCFEMNNEQKYRRLVKVLNGVHVSMAEDDFVYSNNHYYLFTVEAIDSILRVYQDGMLVFNVNDGDDDPIKHGSVGLYCWNNAGAQFADIRIDDFRTNAPIVYRFKFITSNFTNFFHHLHSYQDETWRAPLITEIDASTIRNIVDQAIDSTSITSTLSESEALLFESLLQKVDQTAIQQQQNVSNVQITRIEHSSIPFAFLIQSPEPIDWKRTNLQLQIAEHLTSLISQMPDSIKITDVYFGIDQPDKDSVTILLRETTNIDGYSIEYRPLPRPIFQPVDDLVLLSDRFEKDLTMNSSKQLGQWIVIDENEEHDISYEWKVSEHALIQTSEVQDNDISSSSSFAVAGDTTWKDYALSADLTSNSNKGSIGILFRYANKDNYYLFSLDIANSHHPILQKKVHGITKTLWEYSEQVELQQKHTLSVSCIGKRIVGYLDNVLLFDIEDDEIPSGCVGVYSRDSPNATFTDIMVYSLAWKLYCVFVSEERMSAGTRLRVYSGGNGGIATPTADEHEHDMVKCFIATQETANKVPLPAEGAEFRIMSSDRTIGHVRQFLPVSNYSIINTKVLRKADGTSFFVFVPSTSSPLHSLVRRGQYRLKTSYRRDNRLVQSNSQVFSQNDNRNTELVTIDIPWHTPSNGQDNLAHNIYDQMSIKNEIGSGHPTVEQQNNNQAFQISIPANSAENGKGYFGASILSSTKLSGDFSIQVDYNLVKWFDNHKPSTNGVRIGIGVAPNAEDTYGNIVERISDTEYGGEVYLTHFADGVRGTTQTTDKSGKLKLERSGNILIGSYNNSNGQWNEIHRGPASYNGPVHLIIAAWSHDHNFGNKDISVVFNNLKRNKGTFTKF
jgi:hypothetical protein